MNMGYEDDDLKPYIEPQPDLNDQKRIGKTGTVQQQRFTKNQEIYFILLVLFKKILWMIKNLSTIFLLSF